MKTLSLLSVAARAGLLMRSQWWRMPTIEAHQDKLLKAALQHATSCVPHYRDLGVLQGNDDPRDWLQRFPVLTKKELQSDPARFQWPEYSKRPPYSSRTSGSTGEPTTTYFDQKTWLNCKYALKARRVLNTTRFLGLRLMVIGEKHDDAELIFNMASWDGRLFSAKYLFVEDPIDTNVERIMEFQPTAIYGYPSYLEYLVDNIKDMGLQVPSIPVTYTSSELLTGHARQNLEAEFSGRTIDVYGSTEFKEIAVECEHGRYHINFESVFVESVPSPDNGPPRLLITSLLNKAMPLIRYDIGDHGSLGFGSCECGRHGPYIDSLLGRKSELLMFPDGTAVTAYEIMSTIGAYSEIRNYTAVHRAPEEIAIEVYANPPMSIDRRTALLDDVARCLPSGVEVVFEPLSERLPASKRVAVRRDF